MDNDTVKAAPERGSDRRRGEDRRKNHMDPRDLPFPDRRKGDRRQMDRRIVSDEEKGEILSRVVPPGEAPPKQPAQIEDE